jgi:hypothetical protein
MLGVHGDADMNPGPGDLKVAAWRTCYTPGGIVHSEGLDPNRIRRKVLQ